MKSRDCRSLVSLLAMTLMACSSQSPSDGGVDAQRPQDASAPEAGIPAMCSPPMGTPPASAVCVRGVTGLAQSNDGSPLANTVVTFCGTACFATNTDAQGRFELPVGEVLVLSQYALQVHGRPQHASAYWLLPAPDANGIVRMPTPLQLPRYMVSGEELPMSMRIETARTITVGEVTLQFSAGSRVEFDLEDFELMALGRTVRMAEVPLDRAPPFAAEASVVGPVWAMGPFALVSDRPITVTVPNRTALAAGSPVELVSMGHDVLSSPPTAGHFVLAGRGIVSSDGRTITTVSGAGPLVLTWLAVRPTR
ncbi:MAG: hypothetical protein Q8Q09_00920 [Deltaproteobacteria bacterium]|nr:hypothetical protein [Deltaproteobacteria bacterium]